MWWKVLAGVGLGSYAGFSEKLFLKTIAGVIEIGAGLLDVVGYIFFIAFILGWRRGGERVAVIWPLSIILEAVSHALFKV